MLITSYGADWFDFEWLTDEYRQLAFDLIQSVDYREQLIHDEFGGSNHSMLRSSAANDNFSRTMMAVIFAEDPATRELLQLWIDCGKDLVLTKLSYMPK